MTLNSLPPVQFSSLKPDIKHKNEQGKPLWKSKKSILLWLKKTNGNKTNENKTNENKTNKQTKTYKQTDELNNARKNKQTNKQNRNKQTSTTS